MRKYILISVVSIFGLIALIIFYFSNYGIKTNKFNNFIIDGIKDIEPKLSLELNDVFLKLNLSERSIKINTNDTKVFINNSFINLSEIDVNIDLISFVRNENSIKKVKIKTKENSIKDLTNFLNSYKFNLPRLLLFSQIEDGTFNGIAYLYFDKNNKKKFNYEINGSIKDVGLNLLNDKLNNINFDFNLTNKINNFHNISLNYQGIKFKSDKIIVSNLGKTYEVRGKVKNEKGLINHYLFSKLFNLNSNFLKEKEISIESENQFFFKINSNRKIKNLSINSIIRFNELYFNDKFQNLIFLKDGIANLNYSKKDLEVKIDSKYYLLNNKYNNDADKISINIKKNQNQNIIVETYFKTKKTKINSNEFYKYIKLDKKFIKDQDINFDSDNKIFFLVDKDKIKNLKIKSIFNFDNLEISYKSNKLKKRLPNYNNKIILKSDFLEINYSKDKTKISAIGKYSINKSYDNFNIDVIKEKDLYKFNSSFEINSSSIKIDEIDYTKDKNINSILNINGNYLFNKDLQINEARFLDGKNSIFISNLNLSNTLKVKDIDKLELNYLNQYNRLNNIKILKNKNLFELSGIHFDGKPLVENLLKGDSNNTFLKIFKNLNSEIIINLDKFYLNENSYLNQISGKLILENNELKFGKINAILNEKNEFSYTLKTNLENEKITNIYIEEPEPFIKNYKFIKGFKKGILNYNSIEKNGFSKIKLKISDFKVKEVPVLAKILTLASLQGIADLLTGEGIRFDDFEMEYTNKNKTTTIQEMYVIGPAISILMEGYIHKDKLISLKGTLVPATTINKTISKIPVLGSILVGKKVGEGVFGVSFKIKGPPKKLKSTVNPLKTLTPRFITRTLKKLKGKN